MYDIFYVSKGSGNDEDWDLIKSKYPLAQRLSNIKSYDEIRSKSFTKLFWVIWDDIILQDSFYLADYKVTKWDDTYVHVFKNGDSFDGICLFPKSLTVSQREFDHRFFMNKKEIDVVASYPKKFEIFNIKTYDKYLEALANSSTDMFWVIWDDIVVDEKFTFNYYVPVYDVFHRNITHVFKNGDSYDGVCLFSKTVEVSNREFENRFFINKKEIDIVASNPLPYDIFPVKTYEDYLQAVENSTLDMFWVIWDDIVVDEKFTFNYYVPVYDVFHRNITHVFKNGDLFDGICLFPKSLTVSQREFDHRFFINKKEVDIVASFPRSYNKYSPSSYEEYQQITDDLFWLIWPEVKVTDTSIFDRRNGYNRRENHVFKNLCNGVESYISGVILCSKFKPLSSREFNKQYAIDKKEYDKVISKYQYPIYTFTSYSQYLEAFNNEKQKMFWCVWPDLTITDDTIFDLYFDPYDGKYDYDRNINHIFKNGDHTDGIILCSKNQVISEREFKHRFLINKKEHDRVVSVPKTYDVFTVDSYRDYVNALETSSTEMFWIVPAEVEPNPDFKFDLYFSHHNSYDRNMNHAFKHIFRNTETFNGIMLMSKNKPVSAREIDFRFIIEKKDQDVAASFHRLYDIVFISYNEPNADENYSKLLTRFPRAKRVHGVKGIHNAHIEAAKLADTHMFWVVDGDATLLDEFKFDHQVSRYERDTVHVWRSKNPINDLEYGYGGVKLLPRHETLTMDTSTPDMTTSISKNFKAMPDVSNITGFNTDPFNTWKSAFRECVKLSSKTINRTNEEETEGRLTTWCEVGVDKPFGEYAIRGAKSGRAYGTLYKDNKEMLSKINDFEWLEQEFLKDNT